MNTTVNSSASRILYIDYLRAVSACTVILLHIAAQCFNAVDVHSSEWMVMNLADAFTRWAVPVFVMISGMLFLDPNRPVTVQKIFRKHIFKIAVIYLVWSAVYSVYSNRYSLTPGCFLMSWLTGAYHMWYLFLIVFLYLTVPLLRPIAADKVLNRYALLLLFVFCFIAPQVCYCLSAMDLYPFNRIIASATQFCSNLTQYFPTGFLFYFLLGYYLSSCDIPKCFRKWIYLAGILGYLVTAGHTHWFSLKIGHAETPFYAQTYVNVAAMAIAVFVFGKYSLASVRLPEIVHKAVLSLSSDSLGIYLVHVLYLFLLNDYLHFNILSLHPIFSIPLLFAVVLCLSWCTTAVLKKIPVIGKYLV